MFFSGALPPVSPVQESITLRNHVSGQAWEQGLGTFFYEGVPFSFSTGATFATVIAEMMQALYADKPALYVEELGAGLGMLSVHVLAALRDNFPAFFLKTNLHVTEFSQALATELVATGVFAAFQDKVTLGQEDCRRMSGRCPDVVLMAYVFDAIPARQLVFQSGMWWERQIALTLPERTLWDGRSFPPSPVAASSLLSEEGPMCFSLLRQVWPDVTETETLQPLSWEGIPDGDRAALQEMGAGAGDAFLRVNYPSGLSTILDGIWEGISDTGILLIYDVGGTGDMQPPSWDDLQTHYGLTVCAMVSFSLIQAWASRRGVFFRYTDHPEGNSQVMMLSHQPIENVVWEPLVAVSEHYAYGRYAQVLRDIQSKTAEVLGALSVSEIREKGAVVLGLSPGMASDYTVIMHVATRCHSEGAYAQAHAFLSHLLLDYGAVGSSAWLLQGKILKAMSDVSAAQEAFLRGYAIAPQDEYLLYELAVLSLSQRDYAAYVVYATAYLRYRCYLPDIWETTVTLLLCKGLLGQKEDVRAAIEVMAGLSVKGLLPEGVMAKVEGIQRALAL